MPEYNECVGYTHHCNKSSTIKKCLFCGIDTSKFKGKDWDVTCPIALKTNFDHKYIAEQIQGRSNVGKKYSQTVRYKCMLCGDTYIERDN